MGLKSKVSRRALMKGGLAAAGLPVISRLTGSPVVAEAKAKASDMSFAAIPVEE